MIDERTSRGRIVAAAMRLAASRPWREVTLRDIAEAAGLSLAEMRGELASKGEVLAAFTRAIDDQVLAAAPKFTSDQIPRDRLFDVVMSRFDALAPYKPALKSIAASGLPEPALVKSLCASQAWMLAAANIPSDGVLGAARVTGLGTVYAGVFRTWLDDDDPGHARTMAALDRRLERGEQALGVVEDACRTVRRAASLLCRGPRTRAEKGADATPPPAPAAGAV